MAEDKDVDKPIGIRLLAILSMVVGFLIIIAGILLFLTVSFLMPGNIRIADTTVVLAIVVMLLAIPFLVIGIGMWRLRGWAKSIFFMLALMAIVIDPLRLALLSSSLAGKYWEIDTSEMRDLIVLVLSIILSVFILWYLSRPNVVSAFEASEMAFTKRKIHTLEERIELARLKCNEGEMTKSEMAKVRSDCLERERGLRSRIRHLEKLRLSRERKVKEKAEKKEKAKEEKKTRKEEKRARKEEERAEKKAEKEEKKKKAEEGEEKEGAEEGEEEEKAEEGREIEEKGKKARKKAKKREKGEEEKEGEDEEEKDKKKKKTRKKAKKEKKKKEALEGEEEEAEE